MFRKKVGHFDILGVSYPIFEGMNIIGRDIEASIVLKHLKFSKKHAIISVIGQNHYVTDYNSSNGTKVGDEKLKPYLFYDINDGSHITLGDIVGTYHLLKGDDSSYSYTFKHPLKPVSASQIDDVHIAGTQILSDTSINEPTTQSRPLVEQTIQILNTSTSENQNKEQILCDDTFNDNFDQSLANVVDSSFINNEPTENISFEIPSTQEVSGAGPKNVTNNTSEVTKSDIALVENDSGSETEVEDDVTDPEDGVPQSQIILCVNNVGRSKEDIRLENFKESVKNYIQRSNKNDKIDGISDESDSDNIDYAKFDFLAPQEATGASFYENNKDIDLETRTDANISSDDDDLLEISHNNSFIIDENLTNLITNKNDGKMNENDANIHLDSSAMFSDDDICLLKAGNAKSDINSDKTQINVATNIENNRPPTANSNVKPINDNENNVFATPTKILSNKSKAKPRNNISVQKILLKSEKPDDESNLNDEVDFLAPTQLLSNKSSDVPIIEKITNVNKNDHFDNDDDFLVPTQLLSAPENSKSDFSNNNPQNDTELTRNQVQALQDEDDISFLAPTQELFDNSENYDYTTGQEIDSIPELPANHLEYTNSEHKQLANKVQSENNRSNDENKFLKPQQVTGKMNITNKIQPLETVESETDFSAPTQKLSTDSSNKLPQNVEFNEIDTEVDFSAPTQQLNTSSKADNKITSMSVQNFEPDFSAATQQLNLASKDACKMGDGNMPQDCEQNESVAQTDFLIPAQKTSNDKFDTLTNELAKMFESETDFSAPTQQLNAAQNIGTEFIMPPQKLNTPTTEKISDANNKMVPNFETSECEAQNIETSKKITKINLDDGENEYFMVSTQKIMAGSKNQCDNEEDELFLAPTQVLTNSAEQKRDDKTNEKCQDFESDNFVFMIPTQILNNQCENNTESATSVETSEKNVEQLIKEGTEKKTTDLSKLSLKQKSKNETNKNSKQPMEKQKNKKTENDEKTDSNDDSSDSDIIIRKKRPQVIATQETVVEDSDSDSEVGYRHKRPRRIVETQELAEDAQNKIVNKNSPIKLNNFSFADEEIVIADTQLEESMKLVLEESPLSQKTNKNIPKIQETETQLELCLPTEKEYFESQNNRPNNPLVQVLSSETQNAEYSDAATQIIEEKTVELTTEKHQKQNVPSTTVKVVLNKMTDKTNEDHEQEKVEKMPKNSLRGKKMDILKSAGMTNDENTLNLKNESLKNLNKTQTSLQTIIERKEPQNLDLDEDSDSATQILDEETTDLISRNVTVVLTKLHFPAVSGENLNNFANLLNRECDKISGQNKTNDADHANDDIQENLDESDTEEFNKYCNQATQPIDEFMQDKNEKKQSPRVRNKRNVTDDKKETNIIKKDKPTGKRKKEDQETKTESVRKSLRTRENNETKDSAPNKRNNKQKNDSNEDINPGEGTSGIKEKSKKKEPKKNINDNVDKIEQQPELETKTRNTKRKIVDGKKTSDKSSNNESESNEDLKTNEALPTRNARRKTVDHINKKTNDELPEKQVQTNEDVPSRSTRRKTVGTSKKTNEELLKKQSETNEDSLLKSASETNESMPTRNTRKRTTNLIEKEVKMPEIKNKKRKTASNVEDDLLIEENQNKKQLIRNDSVPEKLNENEIVKNSEMTNRPKRAGTKKITSKDEKNKTNEPTAGASKTNEEKQTSETSDDFIGDKTHHKEIKNEPQKRSRRKTVGETEHNGTGDGVASEMTNKRTKRISQKRNAHKTDKDEILAIEEYSSDDSSGSKNNKSNSLGTAPAQRQYEQLNITVARSSNARTLKLKHKVVFTMLDDTNLEATVTRLGGSVVNSSQECTVLVTAKISRSLKFLVAVSLGKPIVGIEWIKACGQAHKFLDPWDYILKDPEMETKFDFNLRDAIIKGGQTKILEGYTILLLVSKNFDVLKEVIETNGGKCVTRTPAKTTSGNVLVISYEEDKGKYGRYLKQKPPVTVAAAEAIFAGALQQNFNIQEHLLI